MSLPANRISVVTRKFWPLVGVPSSTELLTRVETVVASTHPHPRSACNSPQFALPASEEAAYAAFSLAWRAERNFRIPAQKIEISFGYPLWTEHASPRDTCSNERVSSEGMRRRKKPFSGQSCAERDWGFRFAASIRSAR